MYVRDTKLAVHVPRTAGVRFSVHKVSDGDTKSSYITNNHNQNCHSLSKPHKVTGRAGDGENGFPYKIVELGVGSWNWASHSPSKI